MKRNLDQKITDLDGNDFVPPLTLALVCLNAAVGMAMDGSDNNMAADKKVMLYRLGQKVHAGGVQDFTAEEITTLKDRIGKNFGTLVVGAAFDLLEQDPA